MFSYKAHTEPKIFDCEFKILLAEEHNTATDKFMKNNIRAGSIFLIF